MLRDARCAIIAVRNTAEKKKRNESYISIHSGIHEACDVEEIAIAICRNDDFAVLNGFL